jgi:hypothetical protein
MFKIGCKYNFSLRNGRHYTGIVKQLKGNLILISDKFDKDVILNETELINVEGLE